MKIIEQPQEADVRWDLSVDLDGHFERLMRQYQDRLYSFALRLSANGEDAEEIVQDAFVRAYGALKEYQAERIRELELRPWLFQITLNVFRNRVRSKRLHTLAIDNGSEADEGWEPADHEQDRPEAVAERLELRDRLAASVAALPDRYRAAVVLRFVSGMSYAEMAEILGQPVGTVKANVHRGIQHLRLQVAESAQSLR